MTNYLLWTAVSAELTVLINVFMYYVCFLSKIKKELKCNEIMTGLPYLFCKPLKGMHGGTAIVHKRRSIVHLCTKYRMHKIKVLQVTRCHC